MKQSLSLAFSVLVLSLLMLTAYNKSSQESREHQGELTELQSLRTQVAEQDPLINMVVQNFAQIQQLKGMVSLNGNDRLSQSQRAEVEDNLHLINEKVESNRQMIVLLNKELAQPGSKNTSLQRTIDTLQEQLNIENAGILSLIEEFKHKGYAVGALDSMATGLNNNTENLGGTSAAQRVELERQDATPNAVRCCIGTSRGLKDIDIIRSDKVVAEDYQSDYFAQIDLCRATSIPVYARKAELKTRHPKSSYRLVGSEDKIFILEIISPQEFWSLSRILVVWTY